MNRGDGVLLGIAAGWASTVLFNLGSARLLERRAIRFNNDLADSLPWLLLVAAAAAIVGLLGLFARRLPGGLFGAGIGALLPEKTPQVQQQQYYSPSQPPGQFPG